MKAPGPLLASGRDADIFECGSDLVLRRSRKRRSLAYEARVMEYARTKGYPVPAVEEVSDDGTEIVMERIRGYDMVTAITKRPWTIRLQARRLADLHLELHELAGPEWLRSSPVGKGNRLLHLDLHPLNVILSPNGPVVIDWANACRGDPAVDVALAWVLMAAGSVPTSSMVAAVLQPLRSVLLRSFLKPFEIGEVTSRLRDVVAWKVLDPHMSASEQARMWKVVDGCTSQT